MHATLHLGARPAVAAVWRGTPTPIAWWGHLVLCGHVDAVHPEALREYTTYTGGMYPFGYLVYLYHCILLCLATTLWYRLCAHPQVYTAKASWYSRTAPGVLCLLDGMYHPYYTWWSPPDHL